MNKNYILLFITSLVITNCSFSQSWNWAEGNSGVNVQLNCAATSRNPWQWFGYACGVNGTVIKTTNWGIQWQNISGTIPSNINLITITCYYSPFVGENNNVVLTAGNIGTNTYVYRSSNGGTNWNLVFTQNGGFINSIFLGLDSAQGAFMMGNPVGGRWSLWKSTNAGLNWDSSGLKLMQAGNEHSFPNAMWLEWEYYDNYLWFGTSNNRIYFSSSSGSNWSVRQIPEMNTYTVWAANGSGYVYAADSNLLKSTDQGLNWSILSVPGSGNFSAIGGMYMSSNIAAYARSSNNLYYTTNQGYNWTTYTALSGNYTYISSLYICAEGGFPQFAVRSNGGITYRVAFVGAIHKIENNIPYIFSLSQNYPNPFNPSTKIKFDIRPPLNPLSKEGTLVTLRIFDVLGREIAVLVNEPLKPGSYEVEWNGTAYTSGIYYYILTTGNYSETRKMVLLK